MLYGKDVPPCLTKIIIFVIFDESMKINWLSLGDKGLLVETPSNTMMMKQWLNKIS